MIRFLENKQIDRSRWDRTVEDAVHSSIFGCSWFLDAVAPGWCGIVYNDYEAVFPLPIRSRAGITVAFQPFFSRYFSVFTKIKDDAALLEGMLALAAQKCRLLQLALHEDYVAPADFQVEERKFQQLPLHSDITAIRSNYSDNAKRNIRKGQKLGYSVTEEIDPGVIIRLFREAKGEELTVFKEKDYANLRLLMDECLRRNCGESRGLIDNSGKVIAAAFFMRFGDRLTYLKSGSDAESRNSGAMHLLMDSLIEKYAGTSKVLDFGGSSVESVARFYKNFGGKDCVYLQVKKDRLPALVRLIKNIKS